MKCLFPYYVNAREVWNVPGYLAVPCGKCINCKANRRLMWTFRLSEEMKDSMYTAFATMTYNEENITYIDMDEVQDVPTLNYKDVQLFLKRFRKSLDKYNVTLRYFICGEYGSNTLRPHYHAIFFFNSDKGQNYINEVCLWFPSLFRSAWNQGEILDFQQCSSDGATSYCNKYVNKYYKVDLLPEQLPEKVLMSKGIGCGYIDRMKEWHLQDPENRQYCYYKTYKIPMPRYFRLKIFGRPGVSPITGKLYDWKAVEYISDGRKQENMTIERLRKQWLLDHGNLDEFESSLYGAKYIQATEDWKDYVSKIQTKDKF